MRFWDASGIVPLVVEETSSELVGTAFRDDEAMAVWWGTIVECGGAIARLEREERITHNEADASLNVLRRLSDRWREIEPSEGCRERAAALVRRYPLRASDAFQLAAALVWTQDRPGDDAFCTLDRRLALAARSEGFALPLGRASATRRCRCA